MLDGLLGRSGFSSKCKSLIKPTRTRIEVLRRRAEAKQRFLKEDLAKLLANGLDVNAYGRTEDFIAGLNLLSCYNFIDQSCEYILKQLSVMQKLGQCPEECRETVASLMFAAARFSDLPELRDLRDVFQERYGTGLECYVNQVFVEKLASKPPVVEKRIKLLQDIAAEFSIQWDSNGFKQRMDSPSTLAQDQVRKFVPLNGTDDKCKVPNENNVLRKNDHRSKERIEHIPQIDGSVNARRKEVSDIPFLRTEEKHAKDQVTKLGPSTVTDDKYKVPNGNHVFHKNDHRSKERIEHAYEHNNGNANFRRKEVSNIPFVAREEKYAHQGPTREEKYAHQGPTLDLPFVGREEKRDHRYLSKTRPESDSENNGIGKNHIPSGSSPSHHDRRPEAFNHDKSERGREEKHDHRYLSKTRPEPDYENGIGKNHIPSGSSPSHHDRRLEAFNHDKSERRREEKRDHRYLSNTRPESDFENNGIGKNHIPPGSSPSHHDRRPEAFNHDKSERRKEEKHDHRYLSKTRPESDSENNGIEKNHIPSGSSPSHHDRRPEDFNNDKAHRRRKERHTRMPKVNGEEEDFEKSTTRKVEEEEPVRLLKPCYNNTLLPPPYTKPNSNIPPPYTKPNTHTHHEPPSSGDLPPENPSNSSRRNKEQEHRHYPNDIPIPLPKPRSVRRKHLKSSSSHDDVGSSEDARIVKRISSSRRKERKGLQILFDDEHYHHKDEEEKMMDKLLLHYSKKPSNYDGKLRKKKSSVNDEVELETNVPPMRSISLPHESEQQPKKVYARANSFQPDNQAPHVHPKLPDYDDLAARFAALRGR